MQSDLHFNELAVAVLVIVELLHQVPVAPLYKVLKPQRIPAQVKQVYGKQRYGNTFLQKEILLNLIKIAQTVTHIFNRNLSAVIRTGDNCMVLCVLCDLCVIKN